MGRNIGRVLVVMSLFAVAFACGDGSAGGNAGTSAAGASGGFGAIGGSGATGGTGGLGGSAGLGGIGGDGATAGSGGTGGTAGDAGTGGTAGDAGTGGTAGDAGTGGTGGGVSLPHFSFFVTSLRAMRELSGSQDGFGGDLSYGESGVGAGLRGADKICTEIAEQSMPGSGAKVWHAFLSAVAAGPNGGPVHAWTRIGEGPWYDRVGRLVSNNLTELINERPLTAATAIKDDLPNEDGVPNQNPDGTGNVDNHDFLTGSNQLGELYMNDMRVTCNDWTNAVADANDAPRVGHTWPRSFGPGGPGGGSGPGDWNTKHWISALDEAGCGPGVNIATGFADGPPSEFNPVVGSGGGYGGIYCFAMEP